MAATSENRPADRPGESLPPDLEAIRAALGRGRHQEVKEELKEEAARPHRLRTRLYSLLGSAAICAFLVGLWLLYPDHAPRPETRGSHAGRHPLATVRRAIEGPADGTMEETRQSLEHDLALQAFASVDRARKVRQEFDDAIRDALRGDAGRHVASSDELVTRFRVIVENRELAEAGRTLDAPPREGTPDRTLADRLTERYTRARFQLGVLLEHAEKTFPRADVTLEEAVSRQREKEALLQIEVQSKDEVQIREEAKKKRQEQLIRQIQKEAEEKRWGDAKPGAVWDGTLEEREVKYPVEVTISLRKGDAIEGTLVYTDSGRRNGLAFSGTCTGNRLKWKTTRRTIGSPGRPGAEYTVTLADGELAATYLYQAGSEWITGSIKATLRGKKRAA